MQSVWGQPFQSAPNSRNGHARVAQVPGIRFTAQITGINSLKVRNGGAVELWGDNTYTGTTTIITRYNCKRRRIAANKTARNNHCCGDNAYSLEIVGGTLSINASFSRRRAGLSLFASIWYNQPR
jgi:hypothetical protein